jgi:hypothetical protein
MAYLNQFCDLTTWTDITAINDFGPIVEGIETSFDIRVEPL